MRISAFALLLLIATGGYSKPYGTIVESLFDWYTVRDPGSADIDLLDYPVFLRPRLQEYLEGWNGFRTGLGFDTCRYWEDTVRLERAAGIERGIVALVDHSAARQLALSYASYAPSAYEWEGMPDGPLRETTHAMEYMRTHPGTPLEPFLLLLGAHRARAAWECYASSYYAGLDDDGSSLDGLRSTSEVYLLLLGQALSHEDPLVQWMAGELDDLPYVYIDVRRVVPDSVPPRP